MTDADAARPDPAAGGDVGRPVVGPVTAHASAPGRTVFTEHGNADGWLATDLTVEPRR